jgi:hypothetical protein
MEGPKRIELNELGKPDPKQPIVELRFVNTNGDTEVWLLRRDTLDFEGLSDPTRVRMAYLDPGVDSRLGTQAQSIERLQAKLDAHHTEHDMLAGCETCGYPGASA